MKNVLIVGSSGQLGADCLGAFRAAGWEATEGTHDRIDLTDPERVRRVLEETRFDLVVNTAAYHHLDRCEADPKRTFDVNALGALHLARAAAATGAVLLQISTDYVFDGRSGTPYVETDLPRPLNVYGASKVACEHLVQAAAPRAFVVRVSGLYGNAPCRAKGGLNFVQLMLKLARERGEVRVVEDEILTPTSTAAVAAQILALAETDAYGLYHATCEGFCSWHAFAAEIFRVAQVPVRLHVASPDEFPAKVPRPKYSVLENAALKRLGINRMPDWREALAAYLNGRP